jgi:uncharacterized protein
MECAMVSVERDRITPAMPLANEPKQSLSFYTRDGIRLDADVYFPQGEGPFPVLLMRQPYGRAIASTVVYAHPSWYRAQGYIVVIQDVRGRGTSAGEFGLFDHEIEDGYDSVVWAAALPKSNGRLGMYGFSYQGMTQLFAAAGQPEALRAIAPAMVACDLYRDWAYEGGAFCLMSNLSWALQLAAEGARRDQNLTAFAELNRAAKVLPLQDDYPAYPKVLRNNPYDGFYQDWLTEPRESDYWKHRSPQTYIDRLTHLPMLHIGGWFDFLMRGTLNLYRAMVAAGGAPQHLIVGPWAHLPWGRHLGGMDYGASAVSPIDRAQVKWFDHWLKGDHPGVPAQSPVQLFEIGSNQWHRFDRWPQPDGQVELFLQTTGLVSMGDGGLAKTPPSINQSDCLVHDPWRPVPVCGGHAAAPAGQLNRATIDDRSDVLTFTTGILPEALHILGEVDVQLQVSADQPSFDLSVVLSEVYPDGRVCAFTQGMLHCDLTQTTETAPLRTLLLQPIAILIPAGRALRLSISAACFPAYATNAGTGTALCSTPALDHQVITLTLSSSPEAPSQIKLPLLFT